AIARLVDGRYRLEYPIGKVLYETDGWISHPRVSPKGDMIAFQEHPVRYDQRGSVMLVDLAGKAKTLSQGWAGTWGLSWAPGGDEVWFTAGNEELDFDLQAATVTGQQRLVRRLDQPLYLQDVSRDGRVLFAGNLGRAGIAGLVSGETRERDLSWLDGS